MQPKFIILVFFILFGFSSVSFAQDQAYIVKLIYFLPSDRESQPDIDEKMDALIKDVQQFYATWMELYRFGGKTFRFETDAEGKAVVHHLNGKYGDAHYHDPSWVVWEEISEQFDASETIYLTALDISTERIDNQWCGRGGGWSHDGRALIPASGDCFRLKTAAHELGHAFGLLHDFREDYYLMAYGSGGRLSECAAEWLSVHRYFNTTHTNVDERSRIDMLQPIQYPSTDIRFRFALTDSDGLHQGQFFIPTVPSDPAPGIKLHSCKSLSGKNSDLELITTDVKPGPEGNLHLRIIDLNGNFSAERFEIKEDDLMPVDEDGDGIVDIDDPVPETIEEISGNNQRGLPLTTLSAPFVVQVRDLNGDFARQGVPVKFSITAGGGTLSTTTAITNVEGKAETTLALGPTSGISTVEASGTWIQKKVTFTTEVVPPLEIPDPNLRLALITALGKSPDEHIAAYELETLTTLTAKNTTITNLTGLEFAVNLVTLRLTNSAISDISILAELTKLTTLDLEGNEISDISSLANLFGLVSLNLKDNSISDISPLEANTGLELRDAVDLKNNPLNQSSLSHILVLQSRGVMVEFLPEDISGLVPEKSALLQSYPNPFNPELGSVLIPYHLSSDADIAIKIYDVKGALVRCLEIGNQTAGYYTSQSRAAKWDGQNELGEKVANGLYYYALTVADYMTVRKMILRK